MVKSSEDAFKIKEANMLKHLENELSKVSKTAKEKKDDKKAKKVITNEQLMEDNQLKSAVDILRSLVIMKK